MSALLFTHAGDAGAATPTLSVTPATDLSTGTSVTVQGSGFTPSQTIQLTECEQPVSSSTCGSVGGTKVTQSVQTDATGSFSATYIVNRYFVLGGSNPTIVDCAIAQCALAVEGSASSPLQFANPQPASYYLAMGDSLATGGVANPGQGYVDDLYQFYKHQFPDLQVVDVGCPGETTVTMIHGGICYTDGASQLQLAETFLAQHPGSVNVVTIDIGGDDINAALSPPGNPCEIISSVTTWNGNLLPTGINSSCGAQVQNQVTTNLAAILAGLRSAYPGVPIVGMNYYDTLAPYWLTGQVDVQSFIEHGAASYLERFNAGLQAVYATFDAPTADVQDQFQAANFDSADYRFVGAPWNENAPLSVYNACNWLGLGPPGVAGGNQCTVANTMTLPGVNSDTNAAGGSQIALAFENPLPPRGYWEVASDGGIFAFGSAGFYGSMGGRPLNKPVVGIAATPDSQGYWEVASDGGIFAFGDAGFFGSMGGKPLNKPVVGIAAAPDGKGYWEVASDGGIFAFGSAGFYGSMGGKPLNKPIVGIASPNSGGYWLVASDGGIFAFGDASFYGSTGSLTLNKPVVGMASTPAGGGYWLVASDGGIFAFGDAGFYGSTASLVLNKPVVGMAATPDGGGYWEVASDGGIFAFGDAPFLGSMGGIPLNQPVVGMAAS